MSGGKPEDLNAQSGTGGAVGRPFLQIQFACCNVYQRIYRSGDGKSYNGRCPKCGKPVRFEVGSGGTDCRSFTVY
jgi:hypothetical protein